MDSQDFRVYHPGGMRLLSDSYFLIDYGSMQTLLWCLFYVRSVTAFLETQPFHKKAIKGYKMKEASLTT